MTEDQRAAPPSEVIAKQLKALRTRRGMSVSKLATECARLGMPKLNQSVITNIEVVGRRQDVGIGELLVLARALEVPPVLLFVPLDGRTDLQLTPDATMRGWQALFWVSGEDEPNDPERRRMWRETIGPVHSTRAFFGYFKEAARWEARGDSASFEASLRELARVIDAMTSGGRTPPAVPSEWLDIIKKRGWLQHPDEVPVQAETS